MNPTRLMLAALMLTPGTWAACPDDADVDLCDIVEPTSGAVSSHSPRAMFLVFAGILGASGHTSLACTLFLLPLVGRPVAASTASSSRPAAANTCGEMKDMYKQADCCGNPNQTSGFQTVPVPPFDSHYRLFTENICAGKKPVGAITAEYPNGYFANTDCLKDGVVAVLEQAGANVTKGYVGGIDATGRSPIMTSLFAAGLCPVNVHMHTGAEHLSVGQFDANGVGPDTELDERRRLGLPGSRRLSSPRQGYKCNQYNANDVKFTKAYDWQHCPTTMVVGGTYEVHWPHSAAGDCGGPYQWQSSFYDGVFCKDGIISLDPLNTFTTIGVQAQVFTIVNDEAYYYPDLMRGMIVSGDYGADIAKYTGSTTGTTRNNSMCSQFNPITWQVDRKCQLISASSFDKMCADMLTQADDMSGDTSPHGARELVSDALAANNLSP